MSVRLLSFRLAKHGRHFLQSYFKRDFNFNILEQKQSRARNRLSAGTLRSSAAVTSAPKNVLQNAININNGSQGATTIPRNLGIFRFGQHARKLFIDNILNRVTTTYSHELRTQATRKLFYGDSAPFFALIGVSLASGTGVLTKEDELEGVCWEIREAAKRLQSSWNHDEISNTLNANLNINDLEIGPHIANGCAAVVYSASFKNSQSHENNLVGNAAASVNNTNSVLATPNKSFQRQNNVHAEMMSPIQNISKFVHNLSISAIDINAYNENTTATTFSRELSTRNEIEQTIREQQAPLVAEQAYSSNDNKSDLDMEASNATINRYPLALKMMFNYDIQSNALSILRAMYKETIPARQRYKNESSEEWERLLQDQIKTLPPHPNIVCMFGFFCDEVGNFPDGHKLYPVALPQRIHPLGYGRNMSLYLLMKRYDYSLREFLKKHNLSTRTKLLLLAQLLEAIVHINKHGIAHRDLKSDNILIEMNDDDSPPILVISDFGCCLANKRYGLEVPYNTSDIDKGGNAALMAPEIINKRPGTFAVLNYSKADLWACGAISYEIFGQRNPFYMSNPTSLLNNETKYTTLVNSNYNLDDLPPLGEECPPLIQQLIYNILNPNPSKRMSPDIAANVMHLFLWAPSNWLKPGGMPNSSEVLQWLLSLTTKIMGDQNAFSTNSHVNENRNLNQLGRRTYVEYLLICSFLARAHLRRIRGSLNWIQSVI